MGKDNVFFPDSIQNSIITITAIAQSRTIAANVYTDKV